MNQLTRYIRRHHIALLALFVALGGTSYAAVNLPRGSVGSDQLKHASVTTLKVAPSAITSKRLADDSVVRRKIGDGAVNSKKVANGSLVKEDFAPGTIPTSGTPTGPAGDALTGTYPNPGIADGAVGPAQLGVFPAVRLVRPSGSTQTIPSSTNAVAGGAQTLTWPANADDPNPPVRGYDTATMFDFATSESNIVVPLTGRYLVSAEVRWAVGALSSVGTRTLNIHGPGGRIVVSASQDAVAEPTNTKQAVSTVAQFTANDAIFATAGQSSGADLQVAGSLDQVSFTVTYLGP